MPDCIRPLSLTAPGKVDCAVNFGQTVRAAFGRRGAFAAAFATAAALKTLTAWNAAITATGATKIILTPIYVNPQLPGSEAQFAGENTNESVGGKGFLTGYNSVKYTGEFVGLPPAIKAQLQLVEDEARAELGNDPMEMMLITNDNRLISREVVSIPAGIPFSNFYLQSTESEGFKANNKNKFGLSLDGKWDVGVVVTVPDFDLLTLYPAP